MGPTASGKTDLACELARCFPFEIISVDSAMIYRGLDIGTAKPTPEILQQAPHHLIDCIDPPEPYSAAQFCEDTRRLFQQIKSQGKIPLLVGGTMMYFRALQQGLSDLPKANVQVRKALSQQAEQEGWPVLHQKLEQIDPVSSARIHPHDSQRIQRALEVYEISGRPLSTFLDSELTSPCERYINLFLMPQQRSWLHRRIELRFNQMIQAGLIDEVRSLIQRWNLTATCPAMRCVGYRQVFAYLQGEYDEAALIVQGTAATRQLAKRQLTWLRHWPGGDSFEADCPDVFQKMAAVVRTRLREVYP